MVMLFNKSNRSFIINDVTITPGSHNDVDKKSSDTLLKMYPRDFEVIKVEKETKPKKSKDDAFDVAEAKKFLTDKGIDFDKDIKEEEELKALYVANQ